MSNILHRNPKSVVPDLIDWFEEPFLSLRPYLGHAAQSGVGTANIASRVSRAG
jgi:hypothetical protein